MGLVVPVTVASKENENQQGTIVSEHLNFIDHEETLPNGQTVVKKLPVAVVGVCWHDEALRTPAISYHDPADLVWLEIGMPEEEDDEDEEEEDDEDGEGEEGEEA